MAIDTKDKENLFLKDRIYPLEIQVSILQKRIKKHQKKPRYTVPPKNPTRVYASYKGELFRAFVFTSGTIKFDGQLYNSPSAAGKAVKKGKATNGWSFWRTKNGAGELVPLATLRQ